jgi:predicted nucleic acid-binding protein
VRYWDASVLVCLCIDEPGTPDARRLATSGIVTWSLSAVEIASAIERRSRDGSLDEAGSAVGRRALRELMAAWTEITALTPIRDRALRLVATHTLRAADALQLGAALEAVGERPQGHEFVCADARLRDAAEREGFQVLPASR